MTSKNKMCQFLCKLRCWTRKSQQKCFISYGFQAFVSYQYYIISQRLHIALVQSGLLRLPTERPIWRITHQGPVIISKHWWTPFPFVAICLTLPVWFDTFYVSDFTLLVISDTLQLPFSFSVSYTTICHSLIHVLFLLKDLRGWNFTVLGQITEKI